MSFPNSVPVIAPSITQYNATGNLYIPTSQGGMGATGPTGPSGGGGGATGPTGPAGSGGAGLRETYTETFAPTATSLSTTGLAGIGSGVSNIEVTTLKPVSCTATMCVHNADVSGQQISVGIKYDDGKGGGGIVGNGIYDLTPQAFTVVTWSGIFTPGGTGNWTVIPVANNNTGSGPVFLYQDFSYTILAN